MNLSRRKVLGGLVAASVPVGVPPVPVRSTDSVIFEIIGRYSKLAADEKAKYRDILGGLGMVDLADDFASFA